MEGGQSTQKCDYADSTYWASPLPNVDEELVTFLNGKVKNVSTGKEIKRKNLTTTRDLNCEFTELFERIGVIQHDPLSQDVTASHSNTPTSSLLSRNAPYYLNEILYQDMFTGKALVDWLTSGNEVAHVIFDFVQDFCTELLQKGVLIDQCAVKSPKFSQSRVYAWKNFSKTAGSKFALTNNSSSLSKNDKQNTSNINDKKRSTANHNNTTTFHRRSRRSCLDSDGVRSVPVKVDEVVGKSKATKQPDDPAKPSNHSINTLSEPSVISPLLPQDANKVLKHTGTREKSYRNPVQSSVVSKSSYSNVSGLNAPQLQMKESFLCDYSEPFESCVNTLKCQSTSSVSSDHCLLPPNLPSFSNKSQHENSFSPRVSLIANYTSTNSITSSPSANAVNICEVPEQMFVTAQFSAVASLAPSSIAKTKASTCSPSSPPYLTADCSSPTLLTASNTFSNPCMPQTQDLPPLPPLQSGVIQCQSVAPPPPPPPPPPIVPIPRTRASPSAPPPPPPPPTSMSLTSKYMSSSSSLSSSKKINSASMSASNQSSSQVKKLMKPLYWTKINLANISNETNEAEVWKNVQFESIDESEIEVLFAKQKVKNTKPAAKPLRKPSKRLQTTKILDTKRSQAVAIFMSSLHIGMDEVREAIIKADTATLDIETMEAIYELRPQGNELEKITTHMNKQRSLVPEKQQPLDKPEEFLYTLWKFPEFSELIYCVTFTDHFKTDMEEVLNTIDIIDCTCRYLQSDAVLKLLGVILSVGNILNRGNRTRGSADGFKLDILPKLKDVKANDNSNLLCFIAKIYISSEFSGHSDSPVSCPLPSALDVLRASHVNYSDLQKDLDGIHKRLQQCETRATTVMKSVNRDDYKSFCSFMADFFMQSFIDVDTAQDRLVVSQRNFNCTANYFGVSSKSSKPKAKDFFGHWVSFCSDLHSLWPAQFKKVVDEKKKSAKTELDEKRSTKNVVKSQVKSRDLKSRLETKSDIKPKK